MLSAAIKLRILSAKGVCFFKYKKFQQSSVLCSPGTNSIFLDLIPTLLTDHCFWGEVCQVLLYDR